MCRQWNAGFQLQGPSKFWWVYFDHVFSGNIFHRTAIYQFSVVKKNFMTSRYLKRQFEVIDTWDIFKHSQLNPKLMRRISIGMTQLISSFMKQIPKWAGDLHKTFISKNIVSSLCWEWKIQEINTDFHTVSHPKNLSSSVPFIVLNRFRKFKQFKTNWFTVTTLLNKVCWKWFSLRTDSIKQT